MKVILFGATGMVGQGVLRECLVDSGVEQVLVVSGTGTDGSERGGSMWARVKGATENAVSALPFRATYMFRPGYIQPMHGIRSNTAWYRAIYAVMGPLYPLLDHLFPRYITSTERVGRAMIAVARRGAPAHVLENQEINELSSPPCK